MSECPICYEIHQVLFPWSSCQHYFCIECIKQWGLKSDTQSCPICRHPPNYYFSILNIFKRLIIFLTVELPEHWECITDIMIEQRIIL